MSVSPTVAKVHPFGTRVLDWFVGGAALIAGTLLLTRPLEDPKPDPANVARLLAIADRGENPLAPILAAGEAIRPLHARKTPTQPGDWLSNHAESGQTFAEFRLSRPIRADGRRTTLYIQPLGTISQDRGHLIADTADLLGRFYGLPVKTLPPIKLDDLPEKARRVHPEWQVAQVDSLHLLALLRPRVPDDAVAVLGLTTEDLWPNESSRKWNFVFGQASLRERVGVWSLNRLGDPRDDPRRLLRRTLQVAVHETGHMLGIPHCIAYECGMNGSNGLRESDRQPIGFCPECEMKLWWAWRLDPIRRYEGLSEFADVHGLSAEAKGWRDAQARLERGAK